MVMWNSDHLADASSCLAGLINPAMPLLIAGAVASAVTVGVLGSTVVIPRLKQLPEQSLQLETIRQKLLAQVRGLLSSVILHMCCLWASVLHSAPYTGI
jgi:hypothetical protein